MSKNEATDRTKVIFVHPPQRAIFRGYLKPAEQREYLGGIDKRTHREWRKMANWREISIGGVSLAKVEWLDTFVLSFEDQKLEQQATAIVREVSK